MGSCMVQFAREGREIKAYRTEAFGIVSIVFADNSGKAKAATFREARDAGYGAEFKHIKCRRDPRFDGALYQDGSRPDVGKGVNPLLLKKAL